jgi:hypothetical protein
MLNIKHPIFSYPILSYLIQSCPVEYYPIQSNPILYSSYPIFIFNFILSISISPYPILSHPILSYLTLSYPILSYPTLSYPISPRTECTGECTEVISAGTSQSSEVTCHVKSGTQYSTCRSSTSPQKSENWRDSRISVKKCLSKARIFLFIEILPLYFLTVMLCTKKHVNSGQKQC